jgi:selenocysteine lyase/cysteine desulfurase
LSLVTEAQNEGFAVVLDAAAFLPSNDLDLSAVPADFVAFSAYKIMGFPTGVGALVARKETLKRLRRPWFSGGTVEYASVQHRSRLMRQGVEAFEDGTPAFLSIAALLDGIDFLRRTGRRRVSAHVKALSRYLVRSLDSVAHSDGAQAVVLYGPREITARGGTVAFNVVGRDGRSIPFANVVDRARSRRVSVRGGCFCNPGAAEAAFGFVPGATARCLRGASAAGFSIEKLAECLGPEKSVGAVRASVGISSDRSDVDRLVSVVRSFT